MMQVWFESPPELMEVQTGKLYVSKHTEGTVEHEMVILCTGPGKKPSWGDYKTISGLVIKQTCRTSDHIMGTYSDTWNRSQFSEYEGEVTISNKLWTYPVAVGHSNG